MTAKLGTHKYPPQPARPMSLTNEYKVFIQVITNIIKILPSFRAVKEQRNSSLLLVAASQGTLGCGLRMLPCGHLTACDARGQAGHRGYVIVIHQQNCLFLHLHPGATSAFLWVDQAQLPSLFFCLQKTLPPHRPPCFSWWLQTLQLILHMGNQGWSHWEGTPAMHGNGKGTKFRSWKPSKGSLG